MKQQVMIALFVMIAFFYKSNIAFSQNYYTVNDKLDTTLLNNSKLFPGFSDSALDNLLNTTGVESKKNESDVVKTRLRNNIAAIYFFENDSLIRFHDSALTGIDYVPAISQAMYYNDTLHISAGVGFFAGMGIIINLSKDEFDGKYFQDADNAMIFKKDINDKHYSSNIQLEADKQTLVLTKRLSYQNNEVLFGDYEGSFKSFYEKEQQKDIRKQVKMKVVFKCMLQDFGHIKMRE